MVVTCPAGASRARRAQVAAVDDVVLDLAAKVGRAAAEVDGQFDGIAVEQAGDRHRLAIDRGGAAELLERLLEVERELAAAALRLPSPLGFAGDDPEIEVAAVH